MIMRLSLFSRLSLFFVTLLAAAPAVAQSTGGVFSPLDLPAPSSMRTAAGRPGPDYWQQRVDYTIEVSLDPASQVLRGKEIIRYQNNSPHPLPYLWLHVEQNMCAEGSVSNTLKQPPLMFLGSVFDYTCQGHVGGMTLRRVTVELAEAEYSVFGTTMRIDLARVLAPGEAVRLDIEWEFVIPPYGMARMGRDGTLYEIAQWYPRLAVYDDVSGWNHEPYIGAGEFYLEYGDFDVKITIPREYVVVATGELRNAPEVLTGEQRRRIARVLETGETLAIIAADEAGRPERTRPTTTGPMTWHFQAKDVRDFAFAASPEFRWDATSYDGKLIQTLYRPKATKWEEAIRMAYESIKYFSEQWYPYPYPHATTVEGLIEGMEYPMLTFVPDSPTREDLHWVLAHEFGHEWFPMLVGSNERLYPWMDEGFNVFIDLEGAARYFDGTPYGESIEWNPLALYPENAVAGKELPLSLPPAEQNNLFWAAYNKPALMLQLLRHEILGKERFDAAFRAYIDAWKNRHPTPSDFFRLMEDHAGMNLDWFWRNWVYTAARLDQAVVSLTAERSGETVLVLENKGEMVLPLELKVEFADGSSDVMRFPVEMWNQGPRFTYRFSATRAVRRVTIDPRERYPDSARANNTRAR